MVPKIVSSSLLFVFSSPSGAGKTSITRALCRENSFLFRSVSVTTRGLRSQEKHEEDYIFFTMEEFLIHKEKQNFLEHAFVFQNYYATLRQPVERAMHKGLDVIFDLDWQGARQLKQIYGNRVVTIFILPPSLLVLEHRLRQRKEDHPTVIDARMAGALEEMDHWQEYDYIIVNDQLSQSIAHAQSILQSEHLRRDRYVSLSHLTQDVPYCSSKSSL